jgi:hypothetical protein
MDDMNGTQHLLATLFVVFFSASLIGYKSAWDESNRKEYGIAISLVVMSTVVLELSASILFMEFVLIYKYITGAAV